MAVTFAPEDDNGERPWESDPSAPLLAPSRSVAARVADKIAAVSVFRDAGVGAPPSVVIGPGAGVVPVEVSAWVGGGGAVVQRAANNLVGRGTRLVRTPAELASAVADWPGEPLKVSPHVPGLPVTVSGCVGRDATVVSRVSQQLVGIAALGAGWGAHCGNQLLGVGDVPPGALTRCLRMCHAIGERLRGQGFRGVFGIDAVLDAAGRPWVIEINPRFQTVVSLVHAAEVADGLLPLLGVHVLANLTDLAPLLTAVDHGTSACTSSQLVLHFTRAGRAGPPPETGCYRVDSSGALSRVPDRPLPRLARDEALVWAHATEGDRVDSGDEAVLVQFGHRVATVEHPPRLDPGVGAWLAALRPTVERGG